MGQLEDMSAPNTIIIGGGVAAIAMAHTLKCKLGYNDFAVGQSWHILGAKLTVFFRSMRSGTVQEEHGSPTHTRAGE